MPLPVAHCLLGASIVVAAHPEPSNRYYTPLVAGAFLATAADLDFLLVFIFDSGTWHRGFSHSIMLGLLVCVIFMLSLGKRHIREAIVYGLAFTSHGILDSATTSYATTSKGGGAELLWPFSDERLGLGWIGLSEIPSKLPAVAIVRALAVEFVVFAALLALAAYLRKFLWKTERAREGAT
jgi:membrane-bound metal-dependent hydrolase YbcI (DUF457 family)